MNNETNLNYIEEMEKNSKIFEEKMNRLNSDNFEDDIDNFNNKKLITYNTYNNTYTLNNDRQYIKKNLNRKNNNIKKIDLSKNNPFKYEKEKNNFSLNKNEEKENNNKYNRTTKNRGLSNNNYYENYNSNIIDDKKLIEEIKEKIIKKNRKSNGKIKEKEVLNIQNQYNELNLVHKKTTDILKSKSIQIKSKDEDIIDLKMKLDSIYAQNKNMKAVIEKKNKEIDNLQLALKNMKEEIKLSKNKYNDYNLKQRQLKQDYDILYKEYTSIKEEKDNMKLLLDEQKLNEINLKKEVNNLKKIIKKLYEQLKEAVAFKIKNNILNSDRQKVKEKIIYINNNDDNKNIHLKKNLYKSQFNYKIENKNIDNEDNYNEYKSKKNNNNKSRYTETEEKIIYNNNDDDFSDEDDYLNKGEINKKKNVINSINNNFKKILNHDNINNIKPLDNMNYINKEENYDKNIKNKKIKENEKRNKRIIKNKDKIIECYKDKIKELIDNKDYQIVEKELTILKKEKEKLEYKLLKMPEPPRKLNDIKNKKEINDSINKIENNINYINSLLKKTDGH